MQHQEQHHHLATCPLCRDVAGGAGPRLIAVNEYTITVVGEHQFFRGYCMVIARQHAREMHDLPIDVQQAVMADVFRAGRAIAQVYKPLKINYASLGNVVEHLHWHVIPRYREEADPTSHPWAEASRFKNHVTTPNEALDAARGLADALICEF